MTFLIITHVPHVYENKRCYAYAPYVREMNIWIKDVDEVLILAPIADMAITNIESPYIHNKITVVPITSFDIQGLKNTLRALIKMPKIAWKIFRAMQKADHIHLRCPGNMGLIGSCVQILFPKTPKTVKYAGNWDSKSKQPWTYKLQKWIISNPFLTRKIQVLVYGEWEKSSKNIKPFFTATYTEADKVPVIPRDWTSKIRFIFVGTLVNGKNPLYAIQLVEKLQQQGYDVTIALYGEGVEREKLEHYISQNNLGNIIKLKGNQTKLTVQQAYQESHFVVLPSESEGWPKVVAEGMFWGCIPLSTSVSCVPFMLDYGNRGVVLTMDFEKDLRQIVGVIQNAIHLEDMQKKGADWSRLYTMDVFEQEIKKLITYEA